MSDPALSLMGVSAGYVPDLPILKDIDLHIPRAQVTLIIGPNGAGKSTLIKAIGRSCPGASRPDQPFRTGHYSDPAGSNGPAWHRLRAPK